MLNQRFILRLIPLSAALLATLFAFQNCANEAPTGTPQDTSSSSVGGGNPPPANAASIAASAISLKEGESATVALQLLNVPDKNYALLWEVVNETGGDASGDFALASGFVEFSAGVTAGSITLTSLADNLWEVPDKKYSLRIRESTNTLQAISQAFTVAQKPFSGSISTANNSTCATLDGVAKCWGANANGQLGTGNTSGSNAPIPVVGLPANSKMDEISLGSNFGCGRLSTGAVYCWGNGASGQQGNGATANRLTPGPVPLLDAGVTAIATGGSHACAIKAGSLYCWGLNTSGQLGLGDTVNRQAPTLIASLGANVSAVAAGLSFTCAILKPNSSVKCWGLGTSGQLGNGALVTSSSPVDVVGATAGATAIAAGSTHACAVVNGGAKCWGSNGNGQLGDNTVANKSIATDVMTLGAGSGTTHISAGLAYTCALVNGAPYCWGINDNGQIGTPVGTGRRVPALVSAVLGSGFNRLSAALEGQQTCAIKPPSAIHCWGEGDSGQLGIGSAPANRAPNATPINF